MRQYQAKPAFPASGRIIFRDNLRFYWRISVSVFVVVLLVASVIFFLLPRRYETSVELLLPAQDTVASLPNDHPSIAMSDTVATRTQQLLKAFLQTQACDDCHSVLTDYRLQSLSNDFDVSHDYRNRLQSSVFATMKPDSHVMTVSYRAEGHPEDLPTLLGLYLTAYQLETRSFATHQADAERQQLSKRLKTAESTLREASDALKAYQESHALYEPDLQLNQTLIQQAMLSEQLKALDAESLAAQSQIALLQKRLAVSPALVNLMARLNQDEISIGLRQQIAMAEGDKAQWMQHLALQTSTPAEQAQQTNLDEEINRLYALLQDRLNQLQKNTGDSHILPASTQLDVKHLPGITGIDIALTTQLLDQQLQAEARKIKRAALTSELSKINAALAHVPGQQLAYAELSTRYQLARDKVDSLQTEQEALANRSTAGNSADSTTRLNILKMPTTPQTPISPNPWLYWPLALLLATGIALLSTNWLAETDPIIRRPDQIASQLAAHYPGSHQSPVFEMPTLPNQRDIRRHLDGQRIGQSVPLAMQEVMVHLEQLQQKHRARRIGLLPVSTFGTAQASSLVLALHLAEANHRLMMVDTDFGPQALSRWLQTFKLPLSAGILEGPGLANYLEDQVEDFVDVIYPLGKTVCGSLMPAGHPSNASPHFSPKSLARLEADLSPHYEFVFYTLASLQQSLDAVAVSRLLDGVFLVVHPGITTRGELAHTLTTLKNAETNLLGILYQAW